MSKLTGEAQKWGRCMSTSAPSWESIRCNRRAAPQNLIVQDDVQKRSMDRQLAVVINESHLAEAVHEEIHA
jgi:hypothetical protein